MSSLGKRKEGEKLHKKGGSDAERVHKKSRDDRNKSHQFLKKKDHKHSKSINNDKNQDKGHKSNSNKRDEVKKDRRVSKPNYELIEKLKNNWNKIRIKSTSTEERTIIIDQMLKQMTGNVLQVTLRHDASRMVQSIFQFGTIAQRKPILDELVIKLVEIAKTPYGHFAILKAITHCTEGYEQKKILQSLNGHFVSLGTNVIGARTVETLLQVLSPKLTCELKAEFYGKKFTVLMEEIPRTLQILIEKLDSSKEHSIMDHMRDLAQKFVDKGLLSFQYVHTLLWEYTLQSATYFKTNPIYMNDLINILGDSAHKLMVTKPGSKVVCYLATFANAKDRKRLMKTLKGTVLTSLLHQSAHLSIIRLVDCVDDTVTVQKLLLDEVKSTKALTKYTATGELITSEIPPLLATINSRFGCKLLLRLLNPSKKFLEPDEEMLFDNTSNVTSKKPSLQKRKEHLVYFKNALIALCCTHTSSLLKDRSGSKIIQEFINSFCSIEVLNAIALVFVQRESECKELVGEILEDDDKEMDEEDDDEEEVYEEDEDEDAKELREADEVMNDDEDESNTDIKSKSKAFKAKAAPSNEEAKIELNIHEDPVAHLVLKHILKLEKQVENKEVDASIDQSLWENSNIFPLQFGLRLLTLLNENKQLLKQWLTCNRPCFILSDILQITSAKKKGFDILKSYKKDINTSTMGGQLLAQILDGK
jgi:pumilio family protein 6